MIMNAALHIIMYIKLNHLDSYVKQLKCIKYYKSLDNLNSNIKKMYKPLKKNNNSYITNYIITSNNLFLK